MQYVGIPTHKPNTPSYLIVFSMQSTIPVYYECDFCNFVLALSKGSDIKDATIPATNDAANLISLESFLSVNLKILNYQNTYSINL